MNRILEIPQEKLSAEQTEIFDQLTAGRGRILGPYKIWIHSPPVASGMEQIGTFLNKRSSLSKREVEITILVIAQHWQATTSGRRISAKARPPASPRKRST
jgi:4-carboxymuconolactone decarboxylase